MKLDILYSVWNRIEFTEFSWRCLLENTDWSRVNKLVAYDDGSEDHADEFIEQAIRDCPVDHEYRYLGLNSPVATMNDFLRQTNADLFAKIDNDITVPPDWLSPMLALMEADSRLELLGMEAGRTPNVPSDHRPYFPTFASHIGGIGLMRCWTFKKRTKMLANGRFGFTEWQHEFKPKRGWITPDLPVVALDRIPFAPWCDYSTKYVAEGWQRRWTTYWEDAGYWNWWPDDAKGKHNG